MPRKKELSYFKPLMNSQPFQDFSYSDFISFSKINEFLDFEELSLLEHETAQEPFCQPMGVLSLREWVSCHEFNWIAEGAIQHSFAVYFILMTLLVKSTLRKLSGF